MGKLIIVSNRLPVTINIKPDEIKVSPSVGGLATALKTIFTGESLWIGWPGVATDDLNGKMMDGYFDNMVPVHLSAKEVDLFYDGFSNTTLWPLFHYFPKYTFFFQEHWEGFRKVNELFCDAIIKHAKEDDTIWIHDYHLFLLPKLLREKMPNAKIAYFQHIPFPPFEIFRILPWRKELLEGLVAADLTGFQTHDDVRHYLTCVERLLGIENKLGVLKVNNRLSLVDAFPISIDYDKFHDAADSEEVKKEVLKHTKGDINRKFIISIDRLDYSKGLIERLNAFELFLKDYPEYIGKVNLIMIVVPSREKVKMYGNLKSELDKRVGDINARFRTFNWNPILYFYRSFPFNSLEAFYQLSHVALITSLRDGMNLVSKEYIASRKDQSGVLILSELAGAAKELTEAIIINPYNEKEIADALKKALEMPLEEQMHRMKNMQQVIKTNDINAWVKCFMEKWEAINQQQKKMKMKLIDGAVKNKIVREFTKAKKRMLFLDYDGTLVSIKKTPEQARPDDGLFALLSELTKDEKNKIVITSGRDKNTLEAWFGNYNIDLIAEHGAWKKKAGKKWKAITDLTDEWKNSVGSILQMYVDRTPGSFIEKKDFSLAWHYRSSEPHFAELKAKELIEHLKYITANMKLSILEGKKVVEVRNALVNKAEGLKEWLKEEYDFILAAGDDYTDEDMFSILPSSAFTIKIGSAPSLAKFNIPCERESSCSEEFRGILYMLTDIEREVQVD